MNKLIVLLSTLLLITSTVKANNYENNKTDDFYRDNYNDNYNDNDNYNGYITKRKLKKALKNKTFLQSLNKQHAYFEGSQVVKRFFLCTAEASNQSQNLERITEIKECYYDILSPDILINLNGSESSGIDAVIDISTEIWASLRTNTSFSPTSFYISNYEPGNKAGTGHIEFNFNVLVYQEILQKDVEFPLPDTLPIGPQLVLTNDTLGVTATETGEWKIDKLEVKLILTEERHNIDFGTEFPSFPINENNY